LGFAFTSLLFPLDFREILDGVVSAVGCKGERDLLKGISKSSDGVLLDGSNCIGVVVDGDGTSEL
jgi:hypothetical protein